MSKIKNAMLDRILAVMLALAVLIGVLPIGMAATAQEYPGSYILTVTGEDDTPIEGADIDYTVLVDGIENPDGGSVTTDADGDAPIDLSAYAQELEDGSEIAFDYSISAEGYNSVSGNVEVTDLEGNTIVALEKTEETPVEEVTVSVAVNNSDLGFVTLNGVSAEASNTFVKGEEIELIITPKSNAYISALSIGGTPVTVPEKGDDYSESLTLDADTEISVTFVELVTVSCALLDFASVTFNGEESLLTVDKGSEVAIAVTPDEGYHITEVKLNGVEQTVTDPTAFTATVTADEDIELTYSLVKVYTFVVEFNENGNVTTDPSITAESGKIETILHENGKIKVTATPSEFYRVSQVVVNGETESFTENGKKFDREFTADKDYTVEITFAENVYKVTASVNGGNGSIGIDSTNTASKEIAFDGTARIYVTPDAGYTVNEVLIGGVAQTVVFIEDEGLSYFELTVSGDTDISVSFKVAEAASQDDFSFNSSDALRSDADGKLYVYKKGVKVVFETEHTGLRITDTTGRQYGGRYTKTVEINADTVIKSVETYYSEGIFSFASWHIVEGITSASPLTIVYDDTKPTVELTPDREPNANGFYNSSVDYTVNVSDIIGTSKEYTSLSEISYKIESATVTEGVLYSRNTDGDAFTKNGLTFIVDSSIHNADDIKVTVTANDIAGNSYTVTKIIDINTTAPVVNVSIDGKINGTTAALYNNARKALITITDRDSTFNSDNVKVTINANDAEGNELGSYPVTKGSWAGSNGSHQIEYTFDSADKYGYVSYEWEVTYTNKADMTAEAPTTTGDDAYAFTVDTLNPTGEIGDSSREGWLWEKLLEVKDFFFGLFVNKGEGTENQKVEITASALDASGINSILYYKQSDSKTVLTAEELDKIEFFDEAVSVNSDDTFTVYAKITDNAGNVEYISTNGIIYDTVGANLTTEVVTDASSDKQHNKDVKIEYNVVEVSKEGSYSGIKSVDYKIVKTWRGQKRVTEQGNLFTFDKKKPSYNDLVYDLSSVIEDKDRYITISAKDNNSDNVDVIFTVVDNAGNVKEFSLKEPLVINTAEPKVDVKFGDTPVSTVNGKGYFATGRTATIILTDTSFAWDLTTHAPVITVKLNGEDAKAGTDYILNWTGDGEINEETGMQSHTATLEFITEGSYTWDIEYVNLSDNDLDAENITSVKEETPFNFVIDKTVPEISITVGADDNWTTFIEGIKEVLSFGFYNAKTTVKLNSADAASPYIVEYFTTDNFELKSAEEVDEFISKNGREVVKFEAKDSDETIFTVDPQSKFIVYVRVTDKAGKVNYSSTSGTIVDDKTSSIDFSVLTAPSGQHNGNWGQKTDIYNTDVDVKITVKENEKINSGIKEIKYQIYKDDVLTFPTGEEDGVLYSYEKPADGDSLEDLLNSFEETVTVSAEENDSCNVKLVVLVSDNAGNTLDRELTFDIDCTAPVYDIEFKEYGKEEDGVGNEDTYFNIFRQATITVTERADHFNADNATNGISVIATDSNDKVIGDSSIKIPAYNGWYLFNESEKSFIHISNWNSVGDVHTAVVTFHADANYEFGFSYTDDAGNKAVDSEGKTEYESSFVLDAERPHATVTATAYNKAGDSTAKWSWDYLAGTKAVDDGGEKFGFNKFANGKIELNITDFHDATIDKNMLSIFYYIVEGDKAVDLLDETALDSTEIAWKTLTSTKEEGEDRVFETKAIDMDNQFVAYFKVVDPSGNYRYFSTNGLIVDSEAPQENFAPVIEIDHEKPVNGIYNEDVIIDFTVIDPVVFSGLNAVKCEITASDLEEDTKQEKDLLLEFKTEEEYVELTTGKNGLISETQGRIIVKSDVFNSNNVTVKITATDNAGNESSEELPLMIDVTKPEISVEYDNNEADSENYYKDARKATITITERNFNAEKVEIILENTDKIIPVVSEWVPAGEGEESNSDGKTHTATIDYVADGDYTFIINYTELITMPTEWLSLSPAPTEAPLLLTALIPIFITAAHLASRTLPRRRL